MSNRTRYQMLRYALCLLCSATVIIAVAMSCGAADSASDGSKSPAESLGLMQVKSGYRIELVAAEPLVQDPVAFDWAPDGRLWVAEMTDYPTGVIADGEQETEFGDRSASLLKTAGHKLGGGSVRILEDADGDGKFDKSVLFLDKLNFPSGVMAWRDGVLISAAPDVLFARDTNGDHRADEVKVLLTGFGEGNQQHRVNGFSWGLDNLVHCANGDSGGSIKIVSTVVPVVTESPNAAGAPPSRQGSTQIGEVIDIRGRDFRWNPDTGELDPTSGQTQFGRNRDDFGNWFGNSNSNPMYHFVLDDYYTRRNQHTAPSESIKQVSIAPGPSAIFPISQTLTRFNDLAMANRFTSANSSMVYRDRLLFGTSPTQHVFVSEPVHNLVHHEIMDADGVSFTSRRPDDEQQSEFLASRDNWFRPTQLKTGPDGGLYVADMYRQVIEHPQYIPPAIQATLDLRAGHDKGRIYRIVPISSPKPPVDWPLKDATNAALISALSNSNGTIRDLAHRMLYWRTDTGSNDEIADQLSKLVSQNASSEANNKNSAATTEQTANPIGPLHALSLLEATGKTSPELLEVGLRNSHPAIRRRTLQMLELFKGKLPSSLIAIVSQMGHDPDPFVRMQVAYTLGHPKLQALGGELGGLLCREQNDHYFVAAAMSSIHADNVATVVAGVIEAAGSQRLPAEIIGTLSKLALVDGSNSALLNLLESVLNQPPASGNTALAQILEAIDRRGIPLDELKQISADQLARVKLQLADRIKAAKAELSDYITRITDAPAVVDNLNSRIAVVLSLLGRTSGDRATDATLVAELLVPRVSVPVQSVAIATLARINDPNSATALMSSWKTLTPTLRQQVLDALLRRPEWTEQLLQQVSARTISPGEIDASRQQRMIEHSNDAIRTQALKLLHVAESSDRQQLVTEYAAKLENLGHPGDATRGQEIFKQRQCVNCHKFRDIGTPVGPDLAALTDKSAPALLTAILDPNKAIETKFLLYAASTDAGQTVSGMIVSETGNSITLVSADGKPHTLLRAEIDEFIALNKSLMPEGLEKTASTDGAESIMSAEAMADLIAFIQSSGPSPKKFSGNRPEAVLQVSNGGFLLPATSAEIFGATLVFEPKTSSLEYWTSLDDHAEWTIRVQKEGRFSVRMNYSCDNGSAGNEVVMEVAGQTIRGSIVGTRGWEKFEVSIMGDVVLPVGEHRLTVRPSAPLKHALMDLRQIQLKAE